MAAATLARRLRLAALVAMASAAPVGLAVAAGTTSPHAGATYVTGRGPLTLRLTVSRDGRRVSRIAVDTLDAPCSDSTLELLNWRDGAAPIAHGAFSAVLVNTAGRAYSGPMTVTGRFLGGGRVAGAYRVARASGASGTDESGCRLSGRWSAAIPPPPPPRVRYVGRTAHGQPATITRTRERHPHVVGADFGTITVTCPSPSTLDAVRRPANSNLDVRIAADGRFSGTGFSTSGEAVSVAGRFTGSRVTGRFDYVGRDDCSGTDTFTATRR